ncbi:MAG: tRNA 2-selenouridine(34) synthase MnmH [Lentimicrobiaceae bacterium]
MNITIDISQLYDYPGTPVIDVRSPAEYSIGHIPGAINLPLFDDDERAKVGTRFNHGGQDAGFLLGLEIVGPKMASFVKRIKGLFPAHSPLIFYCWRGGMRSNSMAWLFDQAGHPVYVIKGGYKAFRSYIRVNTINNRQFRIVGGMTGSGKTEILCYLKQMGEQVIDLEGLARHKGSVFGHLGQLEQPSNEEFENNLWEEIRVFNPRRPIYIEDESRSIGKVSLPEPLYQTMQHSTMYLVKVNLKVRIGRLKAEYGGFSSEELMDAMSKLMKYMGGDICQEAIKAVTDHNLDLAIEKVLSYYDKKYNQALQRYPLWQIVPVISDNGDCERGAKRIIQLSKISHEANLSGL